MMRIALMLVAMSSFSCRNERPTTWATRMSLGDAQRWGHTCGDEDLGHQKAASRGLVDDGRSWESTRPDGVRLSCHMEWDGSRGRVAQLWLMVVAPSGYAVQPADFERGRQLLEEGKSAITSGRRSPTSCAAARSIAELRLEELHPAAAVLQAHLRRVGRGARRDARRVRRGLRRRAPLPGAQGLPLVGVRRAPKNVGTALANAMRGIEAANQKHLYGVFGDAQWTNKDRLPDELLKDLIEHFSALSLGNARVASDVMGDAYEYLIKKFADATNKKAGEFYTPRSVVRLMVDILDPKEGETVYDPACGTGGMLLAAVEHVRDAAATRAPSSASSTARRRTSPPPPSRA
jgi:hypothetical protein